MITLIEKIKAYYKRKTMLQITSGLINLLVLLSVIWCSTLFLDMTFFFSVPTRWFVLILNGSLSIFLFYHLILSHVIKFYLNTKKDNYTNITNEIGFNNPAIADRMTNFYQLLKTDLPQYSKKLQEYATDKFEKEIESVDFLKNLKFTNFLLPKNVIILILTSTVIAIMLLPESMTTSFKRILFPFKSFLSVPEYSFNVTPGNQRIIKGDSQEIKVKYSGPSISGCKILIKNNTEKFWQPKKMETQGTYYLYKFENIRDDLFYQVKAISEQNKPWQDKLLSEIFEVKTIVPPNINNLRITLTPPGYTNLPIKYLDNNIGDIIGYEGSLIDISAEINKNLKKAEIVFANGESIPLTIRENKIYGRFKLEEATQYYFKISDTEKVQNQNPIEYSITIIDDYYPTITILDPENDIESIPDVIINLNFEGNDDFGFSDVSLHYKIENKSEVLDTNFSKIKLPVDVSKIKEFSKNFLWNLSELPIGFDESIKYYLSVKDNDIINGPKTGKSDIQIIRFPSLQQLFDEFAKEEEKSIEEMEDLSENNEDIKKELEKIKREIKKEQKIDWDRKKQIEATLNKQNQIQNKLKEIEKKIENAINKLAEKNLFSPDILEKYKQLQELFEDIATPELLESMTELQKSIESLDKKKVEQALNKMSINQEQFKEKLERTLELFKKIQLEQDIDRLVQMAKSLEQNQKKITNELQKQNDPNNKSQPNMEDAQNKQLENLENVNTLEKDLLDSDLLKSYQEAWEKLKEAFAKSNNKKLKNQMKSVQEQMSKNDFNAAASDSKMTEEQLRMLLEKLKQAQSALNQQSKRQILAKMQKTTKNLLRLSEDEEKLMRETGELSNLSDKFVEMAQKQFQVKENMQKVIKDIVDISKETFFLSPQISQIIGKSYTNMTKGLNALEERNRRNAGNFQLKAMAALNEAVMEMQKSTQSMMQSNSGMGFEQFMQQMQKMAGQQGQLNQQGMDFLEKQGNGGKLSLREQGELSRMAAQQEALRRSLEKMNSDMGNRSDILGRMDKIGDEMKKVVEDMQKMNYDTRTIERQQNILSRMLDAQKSVRERQFSKRRKAEKGKKYARKRPSDINKALDKNKEKLRKDLQQALDEGYSIDYEKLIEEYFKILNENAN